MIAVAGVDRLAGERPVNGPVNGPMTGPMTGPVGGHANSPAGGPAQGGTPGSPPGAGVVSIDAVRAALEVSRLTVTRMAGELGIPRATLEAYRLGTRRMPPATRLRLARYLADHAAVLRRLAEVLEGR